jgi:hypothetical protein
MNEENTSNSSPHLIVETVHSPGVFRVVEDTGNQAIVQGGGVEEKRSEEESVVIEPFKKLVDTPLVSSTKRLHELLTSLHRNEEAIMFLNRSDDLMFMLRSSAGCDDAMMIFELVVPYDPAEDPRGDLKIVFDNEYACTEDEAGDYIFETFTVAPDAEEGDFEEVLDMINYYNNVRICECYRNIIKTDDFDVCFECVLRSAEEDTCTSRPDLESDELCTICGDRIITKRGRLVMNCCDQRFHRKCYSTWRKSSKNECPICRK